MPATGNEATRLSQLKSWWDATIATINASIATKLDKPSTAATAGQVLSNNGTQNVWIDAPSGGGDYPQVVSCEGGGSASITLGNGKVVTFTTSGTSNIRVYLLVKVMYSCFEIVQAVCNSGNPRVSVECHDFMNTFRGKFMQQPSQVFFVTTTGSIERVTISVNATTFGFGIVNGSTTFIGALIYVD